MSFSVEPIVIGADGGVENLGDDSDGPASPNLGSSFTTRISGTDR